MQRNSIHLSVWSSAAFHAHLEKVNRCGKCFSDSSHVVVMWLIDAYNSISSEQSAPR